MANVSTEAKCESRSSPKITKESPPPNVIHFEDISAQVYPDRPETSTNCKRLDTGSQRGLATGEGFIKVRCLSKIAKVVESSPLVKLLMSALKSKGCELDLSRHIVCENCSEEVTGGYDTLENQIIVCQNRVYSEEMTAAVISHELIHMFDYCRAKMDFANLEHIACSEIRAANLVHCSMTSSFFTGTTSFRRFGNTHRECVKAKALASLLAVRKGFPVAEGVRIIDGVFDRCYGDLEPVGRRLRLNSPHMKWAYRERFHYNYDSF